MPKTTVIGRNLMASPSLAHRRGFLVLCGLVLVVDTIFFTTVMPLLPYYADRFGLSAAEVGFVGGAYPGGGALIAIPAGIVATRIGAKPSLLVGLAVMALASVWLGQLADGPELILARFVQGIGSTIAWISAFAWLLARVPAQQRGAAIGLGYGYQCWVHSLALPSRQRFPSWDLP